MSDRTLGELLNDERDLLIDACDPRWIFGLDLEENELLIAVMLTHYGLLATAHTDSGMAWFATPDGRARVGR